ncbi:MAG: mannose-6-phosphate isomerase, type 1 [Haloplasmataceae bacterium]|jgi:mannose-6-phosphate isomerase|nr:mannose-6-phosphate isomerase, type 1 [Haloplasmataceae bacterium]
MQKILFLEPIFQSRIWGGTKLRDSFNYNIPNDLTGECWAISAHKNGDCTIINGPLEGKKLSVVYRDNRELFNDCESATFPLLTKILDANDDLSIQVHPDDEYAMKNENDLGKTECWYILDCQENAEIVFGHHAKTKEELVKLIANNEWDQLLKRVKVEPGDFFYVPSGTIHALCKGLLVLETQQSSDTTYRVYDYNRKDASGNTRQLHVNQAIEVTNVPHVDYLYNREVVKFDHAMITTYVKSDFFTVEKWQVEGSLNTKYNHKFLLVSVLKGEGHFLGEPIKKGDHFIVTSINDKIHCQGNFELMVSYL